jgi:hypothetical protein
MSAPALGFYGEMWGWMHSDEVTYQQAIDALLENYGLILIENPTNATARITLNPRDKELSAVNAMNVSRSDGGWRTVNVGFRMTIPADWEKERVVPMDSNCGGFEGETVHLEFDEVYYGMVAGTGTNTPAVIDVLRKKQANPKFLRAGEEIWQLDGRFADFIIGKVEPTSGQAFTNMARLSVPYPDQSGYLAVYLYYQSERDVPILRRILQSIEWKK